MGEYYAEYLGFVRFWWPLAVCIAILAAWAWWKQLRRDQRVGTTQVIVERENQDFRVSYGIQETKNVYTNEKRKILTATLHRRTATGWQTVYHWSEPYSDEYYYAGGWEERYTRDFLRRQAERIVDEYLAREAEEVDDEEDE